MFRDVYCPVRLALYPKVNILALENSVSSTSQGGQKFEGFLSHDHVPREVPPKPWTNMISRIGLGNAYTRVKPSGSVSEGLAIRPDRLC